MTGPAVVVRLVQLAAGVHLVGALVFLLLVWRPAWRGAGPAGEGLGARVDRGLLRLAAWALVASLAVGLVGLVVQAASVSGAARDAVSPTVLARLLTGTQYGLTWLARMAGLLLVGGFLLLREAERDWKDWWAVRLEVGLLGTLAFAALAVAGHAATAEEWGLVPLAADAVHLVAAGMWLGGLLPLAWVLGEAARQGGDGSLAVARAASRRFSTLALGGMMLLVPTGLVSAWIQVGGFPALVGSGYGGLLLLKLALLIPILVLAAANRVRLVPALRDAADAEVLTRSLRRLRRNVCLEAALGLAILLVVAGLGVTPPARHVPPAWPFSFRFAWQVTKDLPGVQTRVAVGSQLAVLGLTTVLLAAIVRRRRWPWVAGAGGVAVAIGLGAALPPLAVDAYPTTYLRPPLAYTAISVARGQTLYREHCARCHGVAGYGDGPAATGLRVRPADLTARHTADHTVGDLFWWLTHGIPRSGMPGFGDRLAEDDRWDLINFLRTLAAAEQARGLSPVVEPTARLVAPDFAFTRGLRESYSLKDYRERAIVVLVLFTVPDSGERLVALNRVYGALRLRGAEVLGIPMGAPGDVYRALAGAPVFFPVVVDGAIEAVTTYLVFRRDLTPDGQVPDPPGPRHMELLVDRQGYVRARWIPDGDGGWADPERLVAEVERLAVETPRVPVPDEHVH
jgi:putative copper resistance protein D